MLSYFVRFSSPVRTAFGVWCVAILYLCGYMDDTQIWLHAAYEIGVCVRQSVIETFTYNDMHVQITFMEFRMHHRLRCDGNSLLKCICVIVHTGHHHHWSGGPAVCALYAPLTIFRQHWDLHFGIYWSEKWTETLESDAGRFGIASQAKTINLRHVYWNWSLVYRKIQAYTRTQAFLAQTEVHTLLHWLFGLLLLHIPYSQW